MARSAFYEESAISTNERRERRAYQVFHIASIVMLVIAALLILFSLTSVPSILSDEKLTGTQKAVSIVVWFLPILSLVGFFFLFRFIKRRKNLSFDYTFVEDELRVTKVFNGKSRKHLRTFKADQILKIGYVDSDSFERTLAGMQGKKAIPLTPNDRAAEGKMFIYLLYSSSIEKSLYILECRKELLEYLVFAAGRNKFESK